jgi:hypothetical protein
MKNYNQKYKCRKKYNKRIKYFQSPFKVKDYSENNNEINYDLDSINIQSFKLITKKDLFISFVLFLGIFYVII